MNQFSERVAFNGVVSRLSLTEDGKLQWGDQNRRCLLIEKEALGFEADGLKVKVKAVVENGGGGPVCCVGAGNKGGGLVRKDFVFEFMSEGSLRLFCGALSDYIDSLGRPKKLLVLVNPFGGKRSAPKIFVDHVEPLFKDADIDIYVQETLYQLHAKEIASALDLSKYDGIVCVSGDGLLVEVVNGLLEREDWKAAIQMPIGMVPAGTGNGMARSLLDLVGSPCTLLNAVLAIIRGHRKSLDVATVMQGKTKFFSVLMLAWGLVADIDIESEKYRWMGSARLDFYALQRIVHLRKYNGRIHFVPAPGSESFGEPAGYNGETTGKHDTISLSEEEPDKVRQYGYQGPHINLENLDWRAINGPFISVWLQNVPWGSEDTMAAPNAKFSDGYLDLVLIKDCPKFPLISLMTELKDGGHVKSPYVTYLKVKSVILEPGPRTEDPTKEGIIDSDGEVLARGRGTFRSDQKTLMSYDKLQITVDQGLATLFSPV